MQSGVLLLRKALSEYGSNKCERWRAHFCVYAFVESQYCLFVVVLWKSSNECRCAICHPKYDVRYVLPGQNILISSLVGFLNLLLWTNLASCPTKYLEKISLFWALLSRSTTHCILFSDMLYYIPISKKFNTQRGEKWFIS